MKYGVAIRNMGSQSTREMIRACAKHAESLGYDALFVSDHLCIPPDDIEGSGGRYLDVLATLAYLAGATDRIRLGISVLVAPYRPAVLTAKQVATIQELSAERMILGVGVGWMKREFEALGVDKRMRGRATNETLRVMRHLFTHEAEAYKGDLVSFPPFVFLPRPKCPPIWIGGNGDAAMRRVLEFGDGWHPMLPAEKLKPAVATLKQRLAGIGRGNVEIVARRVMKFDDLGAATARLHAESDAGATYFILDLGRYPSEKEFAQQAEIFVSKIAK
jgi:probable F420-dependent oxidoreductase